MEDEPVHLAVAAHGHVVKVQEVVQLLHPPLILLIKHINLMNHIVIMNFLADFWVTHENVMTGTV